ncbi:universal stress protein [Patulibacter sp.]|uniref:universal stress protein n=1 Tax=Patulibacter sp. TaxID=1912859 RepID=UPI002726BC19|nr:universal stress protein [Patulibacter sp.]MDO9407142.1 universal stress protein [Patulibacter sp.]
MTAPDSTAPSGVVLIAYDGSANADHAIDVAGALLGGGPAEVVHAWEPVSSAAARSAVYAIAYDDTGVLLERERALAAETAEAGVARARAAGFEATGSARSGSGPLWQTIVERAEDLRPRLIVMGTRGLTGVRSALAGSVSHHVASHADVPVLTVPLAEEPRRGR